MLPTASSLSLRPACACAWAGGLALGQRLMLVCAGFFLLARGVVAAAEPAPRDYQIKAVFLFNFAQFVEWPTTAFPQADGPLVVGVLGADPFGSFLDEVVRSERVNGHPLVVRRFRTVDEIDTCHILFLGHHDPLALSRALESLRGRGVLTVGDAEIFNQQGGMIRFVSENNRVRLRINLQAARAAGLVISSKLLRPAEIVVTPRSRYLVRR